MSWFPKSVTMLAYMAKGTGVVKLGILSAEDLPGSSRRAQWNRRGLHTQKEAGVRVREEAMEAEAGAMHFEDGRMSHGLREGGDPPTRKKQGKDSPQSLRNQPARWDPRQTSDLRNHKIHWCCFKSLSLGWFVMYKCLWDFLFGVLGLIIIIIIIIIKILDPM